jgi:NAD(P)-dependent dehydrogenase (short-subunit alcohol dehydrogenase family)
MTIQPSRLFDLSGRVALITGGGGALGSTVGVGLALSGATVIVVDLQIDRANEAIEAITAASGTGRALSADLSSADDVQRVFEAVDREFGRIDILVNAVSAPVERFAAEDFPLDAWQRMIDSNLTSYFLCSQAAARRMIDAGRGGSIINFSSIAGATALGRGSLAYSAAKGGVGQLTRELAFAWATHQIRVNAILPCQFINSWWAEQREDPDRRGLVDRVVSGIPLGRMGEPDEMVGPVLFLASDAASMVTGVLLPVDGGNLAMNAGASFDW